MAWDLFTTLGIVGFGVLLLLYGLTVTYGVLWSSSKFVERIRAAYEYRTPSMTFLPISPARIVVSMPWFGVAVLIIGVGMAVPLTAGNRAALLLVLLGFAAALGIALLAFVWPRPFLPRWAKEADARRKAGLPPLAPEPKELQNGRATSKRTWYLGHAVLAIAIVANVLFHVGPSNLTLPLLFGWAFWISAQRRAASGS